jgi:4-diphosphocytidyl-2-C-methyl-D-erythritol kinase
MVTFPNAKVNIGLQILEKRNDGFHNIASCFYPVGWADILEIIPAETLSFKSSGIDIPGEASTNLCLRAYYLLKKDFDLPPVAIHLHKIVPIGAGLGGGSADAAFTLKMLNEMFELNLDLAILENYARQLGSDCAFFIKNSPVYCVDKGDVFESISMSLAGKTIVMVYPNLHISTAEAYAGVVPTLPLVVLRDALADRSIWPVAIKNDFEKHLFDTYPVLNQIKEQLYQKGASYASMTGSGSTIYGIFDDQPLLDNLFDDYLVWQGPLS